MKKRLVHSSANAFCLVNKKEYILLPYIILTSLSNVNIPELCVCVCLCMGIFSIPDCMCIMEIP